MRVPLLLHRHSSHWNPFATEPGPHRSISSSPAAAAPPRPLAADPSQPGMQQPPAMVQANSSADVGGERFPAGRVHLQGGSGRHQAPRAPPAPTPPRHLLLSHLGRLRRSCSCSCRLAGLGLGLGRVVPGGHGGETRTFVGRDGAHVGQSRLRRRSDIAVVVTALATRRSCPTGSRSAEFHESAVLAVHRVLQVHRLRTGKTTRIRCCPGPTDAFCVSISLSVSLPMSLSTYVSLSALPPSPSLSLYLSLSLSFSPSPMRSTCSCSVSILWRKASRSS